MSQPYSAGRITLLLLLFALFAASALVLYPFAGEIFMAGVLAVVVYPVQQALEKRMGRRSLSVWITTLGVGLLFLLPLGFFGVIVVQEAKSLYARLGNQIGPSGGLEFWNLALDRVSSLLGVERAQLEGLILSKLQGFAGSAVANTLEGIQGVGSWLGSAFIALVTMFFLLDAGANVGKALKHWSPLSEATMDRLFAEIKLLVFANIYGVFSVSAAQGILLALGFWALGLPNPILWGAVTAVLSVIPMLGAGLVWVPGAIYLLSTGSPGKAALLALWGALVVSMADNVIRPIVLGERTHMHTGIMFFALLGGIQAFGLIGLFAGPIVFSLALVVLRLLRAETTANENETITNTTLTT